jgi:hypothetical protein
MRRPRIDAAGRWQIVGVGFAAAAYALAALVVEPPWGYLPAWLTIVITIAAALAASGGLLFAWRGGRRERELEMRWWIRNGALPPDLPVLERLQRIRSADDAIGRGWMYIAFGVVLLLIGIGAGPSRLLSAAVWLGGGGFWLARSLPHRRTIKRLLTETEDEARAAGVYPRDL